MKTLKNKFTATVTALAMLFTLAGTLYIGNSAVVFAEYIELFSVTDNLETEDEVNVYEFTLPKDGKVSFEFRESGNGSYYYWNVTLYSENKEYLK
ncbi:MAG: hypothetical protein LBR54_00345, partial [Oscillospiraceae bacterium]|nr:hypothetical protein [Oscillospiraceae bacterium]